MKLLIATTNIGKFGEIAEVLSDTAFELFHLRSEGLKAKNGCGLSEILDKEDFEETGETFEENAEMKAMHYHELTGLPTIGEDSGIIVDALKGELGVKTRRWGAGGKATDEEWIEHFMKVMKDIPADNRSARFICCAAFIDGGNELAIFKGQTEGIITAELEAPLKSGIPLSSCFRPVGVDKVYAALNEDEKNKISHRGKAFHELKEYIKNHFA